MIQRYLKYLYRSKTRYKVHSPFVFDLINQILRKKRSSDYLKPLEKKLKNNNSEIEVHDFGAGSRKKSQKQKRIVKHIYKTSSSKGKKADLIRRISEYQHDQFCFLELGTNLGITSFALAQSSQCNKVITIEGCPNIYNFTKDILQNHQKIEFIQGQFDQNLPTLLEVWQPQVVYIDGNHTYEATKKYFDLISSYECVDLIIFDDIYWSDGMLKAWEEVIESPRFNVSVNIYQLGLFFRREGQKKEDFIIRY